MTRMTLDAISSEPVLRPPLMVVWGAHKIGKSTFVAGASKVVILPVAGEEGVDEFAVAKMPVANTYDDVMASIHLLEKGRHDYRVFAIDSVTALERLVWQRTCLRNGWQTIEAPGYGKGYLEADYEWRDVLEGLERLRSDHKMTVVLIGHTTTKMVTDPRADSYTAIVPSVQTRAAQMIDRWADCTLFADSPIYTTKDEKTERTRAVASDKRVLITTKSAHLPGGGRGVYGRLPREIPLNWGAFRGAVKAQLQKEKAT